jgi:uncharacterized protein YceH (UPF0502 family)
LMSREPPLVKVLARQPGTKESRYIQLLSGEAEHGGESIVPEALLARGQEDVSKLSRLESEMAELRSDIAELKQQFAAFRKQFE